MEVNALAALLAHDRPPYALQALPVPIFPLALTTNLRAGRGLEFHEYSKVFTPFWQPLA